MNNERDAGRSERSAGGYLHTGPKHHRSRAVISRKEALGLFPSRTCLWVEPSPVQRHLAGRAQKGRTHHLEARLLHLISGNILKWLATSVFSLLKTFLNWVRFSVFLTAWTGVKLLFC